MAFQPIRKIPQFSDLKSILARSQDTDNSLYIVVEEIIDRLSSIKLDVVDTPAVSGGGGGGGTPDAHHVTHEPGGTDQIQNVAWTNLANTFTQAQTLASAQPTLVFNESDQPADAKNFAIYVTNQRLLLQALNDAQSIASGTVLIYRDGTLQAPQLRVRNPSDAFVILINDGAAVNNQTWRFRGYTDGNLYIEKLSNSDIVQVQHSFRTDGTFWVVGPYIVIQNSGDSKLILTDNNQPANKKSFTIRNSNQLLFFEAVNDNFNQLSSMSMDRDSVLQAPAFTLTNGFTSSNPRTIDYYEEGSWTPKLSSLDGGTGTAYTTQNGRYTRIGNIVHVTYLVVITTWSWTSGTIVLTGLPFPNSSSADVHASGVVSVFSQATPVYDIVNYFAPSTAYLYFFLKTTFTGSSDRPMVAGDVFTTTNFRGTMVYRVN